MAEKRMFSKSIIDSDAFLDMPVTSQLLYFHLAMRADDDGFINKPKSIMRTCCCKEDDMKLLITKKFIIPFESGVVVIKHWKIHNYIAKDRYKETNYKEEKGLLALDENKAYTFNDNSLYTECIQNDNSPNTQVRLDKISIDKESIGECEKQEPDITPTKHPHGEFNNVFLTDEEYTKIQSICPEYIERLSAHMASSSKEYPNHYATIIKWLMQDKDKQQAKNQRKNQFNNFQGSTNMDIVDEFEELLKQEMKEQPKTAAEDAGIRERAEALKKQFAEGKGD